MHCHRNSVTVIRHRNSEDISFSNPHAVQDGLPTNSSYREY
jgi:hypothetical protein